MQTKILADCGAAKTPLYFVVTKKAEFGRLHELQSQKASVYLSTMSPLLLLRHGDSHLVTHVVYDLSKGVHVHTLSVFSFHFLSKTHQ